MRSLKSECLNRMIFFVKRHASALREFGEHFHHDGIIRDSRTESLMQGDEVGRKDGELSCPPRLGGLARYYYRDAA